MKYSLILFIPCFIFYSCSNMEKKQEGNTPVSVYFNYGDSSVQTAGIKMIPIHTPVGDFKVWTKRFGNNSSIKILLLHGGPAFTHEYMECFESFFPKEGFEFYEYDQLGSYYSDQPKDSSLWTTARFVEEVEQVRKAIGADRNNFYVLGNSWGGLLAMEYALKYQDHMKAMIVANMVASIPDYEKFNTVLRDQMRKSLVDSLINYEAKGMYKDSVYQSLVFSEYYTQHLCRLPEWPDPVLRAFKHVNDEIYVMMQGPSEFKTGGRLLKWDIKDRLKEIKIPTLMVGAKFDTMDPAMMEEQSRKVQRGRYLYCPNGSHLAMWDDQKIFMDGVIRFIRDVNMGSF
jgi:proline iminopeptidase